MHEIISRNSRQLFKLVPAQRKLREDPVRQASLNGIMRRIARQTQTGQQSDNELLLLLSICRTESI